VDAAGVVVLVNVVIGMRYLVVLQHQNRMQDISGSALGAFLNRYDSLWSAAGLLWGASTALFFPGPAALSSSSAL